MTPRETLARLALWESRCDPDAPPSGESPDASPWYVPLDPWRSPGNNQQTYLRGPSAARALASLILRRSEESSPDRRRSAQLFTGFRGAGKTTELTRVRAQLESEQRYAILTVRAELYHHMSEALTAEEMALVLAAGIGEGATESWGARSLATRSIWERIRELLRRELNFSDLGVSMGPLELRGLLREGRDFKERLARATASKPDLLRLFLHDLVRDVAAQAPGELVVMVDGLEKYYVPQERVPGVYQAVADLFFHQSDLLNLPSAHVIYTVPPYTAFLNPSVADRFGGFVRALYSVKVHGRPPERAPFEPGLAALREVLSRRVPLAELFGDEIEACTRALASASGGHVRDLLHLTREVIGVAQRDGLPVGSAAVTEAIRTMANGRGFLFRETRALLERVAGEGSLNTLGREELGELTTVMDQYLVLAYQNGEPWYDVHPLLLGRLQRGSV